MIEIAVGKHFRENHEDKHKRDAKNGWYRYDSRFALPVYDDKSELERYNVFHASMLVRHSNDDCQSEYSKYLDMQKVSRLSYFYGGVKNAKSTITCANVNATQGFKKKGKR
ncbi:MAG: hypothetical protein MJ172_07840 [Clostridia bacterium]|nr:hypothetical protein [Clostridia bacterium]